MAASGSQNSTTPFFGCKISLISKSEIRYEGILYTIDPKESTIALAKVRSYGSEDRPVERPVPPRDDIFEFIIFRASDIKDLIVDDPPPAPQLTDPAIIQAQHSTSTSFPSSFPQGSISQQPSAGGPSGPAPIVAPGAGAPQQAKPIQQLQPQQAQSQQQPKQQRGQQQQQQATESSTDGQNVVKLSKPAASNVAGAPGYSKVAGGGSSAPSTQQQQPKLPSSNQRNQQQQNLQFNNKQQQQPKTDGQQQQAGGVPRLSQQGPGQQQNLSQAGPQNGYSNRRNQQNSNNRDGLQGQNRVLGEGQNPNYHARNGQQQQQQGGFRPFNQRFGQQGGRGGFNQSGTSGGSQQHFSGGFNRRGGPGGFSGPRNFSNRPGGTGLSAHPNGPKFAPLPDGDFDFEKAQADFKILEEKLHALRINGSVAAPGGDAGPDAPSADSTDVIVPGIPLSAISVAALEQQDQEIANKEVCYNKTKSFFDSISCEALEREKGSVQRVDWKQERKMNRETFGVVSARRPTFFRMNNRGGGFGGGYHHNHRGGYRNNSGGDRGDRSGGDGQQQDGRRPGGHFQNRSYQQNRGPRTPTSGGGQSQSQNISSTTNGGGGSGSRTTPAKASNGVVGASPVVAPLIATKN